MSNGARQGRGVSEGRGVKSKGWDLSAGSQTAASPLHEIGKRTASRPAATSARRGGQAKGLAGVGAMILPLVASQVGSILQLLSALQRAKETAMRLPERKIVAAVSALKRGMGSEELRLPEGRQATSLGDLRAGPNDESAVVCRVLLTVNRVAASPVYFVAVGEDKDIFIATILGLQQGVIMTGHNLLLAQPELEEISICETQKVRADSRRLQLVRLRDAHSVPPSRLAQAIRFRLIRIPDPGNVLIDGTKRLKATGLGTAAVSTSYTEG